MLTNATIRYLENELRHYHKNRKDLAAMYEDIEESSPSPPDGMPRGNGASNPTESKAIRIMSTRAIIYLERRLNAIETVLKRYNENSEVAKMVQMMYFDQTHTAFGVMGTLHISQKTFYRRRRELMEDLANEIGL